VENGEVTLTGFVEHRDDKRALEDMADDVFGVEEVHNHLRLRREARTGESQTFTAAGQGTAQGAASSQTGQRAQPGQPQQPGARH
jgi:hypothetical protein